MYITGKKLHLSLFLGSTALLQKFADPNFSVETMDYVPTIRDSYSATVSIEGRPINLSLYDTAGQEEYEHIRPDDYPDTVCL